MRTDGQTDMTKLILDFEISERVYSCISSLLARSLYGTLTVTVKTTEYGLPYRDAGNEQPHRQAGRILFLKCVIGRLCQLLRLY